MTSDRNEHPTTPPKALDEYGVATDASTVRFERLLPGPIERVWAYLTESDKRAQWFASGPMDLRIGGRVELKFRHSDLTPHSEPTPERYKKYGDGPTLDARVTRCEPPRLLSFTWGDQADDESEVTFELTPQGGNVLLVLTHRRLANREAMRDVAGGWHTHLGILADKLNGRTPGPFWSTHERNEAAYRQRFGGE